MKKILVIEDETGVRENLLDLLEAEDFDAIAAENGREGIELAKEKLPDLILCDVMMPEIDGYGVLTELRQDPATAIIPFIFLTAKAAKGDTRQGMELGADDYLTKPFSREEILAAISTRLQKQSITQKNTEQKLQALTNSIALALPHELRTPMNGILGYSELLLQDIESYDKAEIQEMLEGIQISAKRLYRLVQNYLLYAELEIAIHQPQRLDYLRDQAMSGALSMISQSAGEKAKQTGREADLQMDIENAFLKISETHLYKIVEELVDNACKYSEPGTPIAVKGEVSGTASYTLSVTDLGRGMTREQIANHGAYIQFDRQLYEQQGTGLGMAIAKRLAELYGGKLTIESIPNQETTVSVVLPIELSLSIEEE
ncbi:hybrid sensor histidine kinase/response regulator [Laspinema olomoucense]|uniref:histidine kinase n=1 Tax=Laspinema olomoucense D3b TaxID=2953688 RepID=A0ABT2NBK4_9CYAN|nr:response regulator [Laspinema sp. D3b]MCT7980079.1 response regulator [Laspinema sp. D3b]